MSYVFYKFELCVRELTFNIQLTALYYHCHCHCHCYYNSHTTQLRTVERDSACYGLPVFRQVRLQQTLHISGNLWGREILLLKWIFRNTHRASPYSPKLSSQEGVRNVQPTKVPESTHRYPV